MAKVKIDSELLARLAELAASAMNDTVSHSVIKEDTEACDSEIHAAVFMFSGLSCGSSTGLPENILEFKELATAIKGKDFKNRFFG